MAGWVDRIDRFEIAAGGFFEHFGDGTDALFTGSDHATILHGRRWQP